MGLELDNIYLFKVKDYTTIILGRFNPETKKFFVQRGDGLKYEYWEDEVVWKQKLTLPPLKKVGFLLHRPLH